MTLFAVIQYCIAILFIGSVENTILRLPCDTFAEFRIFSIGKRLTGHVLRTDKGLEDGQCMMKCVEHRKCRSYNLNVKDKICELNSKAHADNGTMLADETDWIYKSTDYKNLLVGATCKKLNPCKAGVLCKDKCEPPFYECIMDCSADQSGSHCKARTKDGNNCDTNPCSNSETCILVSQSYKCKCKNGYTGKHCETDINECYSLPCFHGGRCEDKVGGFSCHCVPGYTGINCETNYDECSSSPCQNGNPCNDQVNGYRCTCAAGYRGGNCETNIDECSSSPCQNGGRCTDQVNGYTCNCASGYTGTHCETDYDECSSSPCQNGNPCNDQVNGYRCTCAAGYRGGNCETNIDECSSSPCQHGGRCTDQVNGYTCNCASGYIGTHCETEKMECSSNPCSASRQCIEEIGRYACVQNVAYRRPSTQSSNMHSYTSPDKAVDGNRNSVLTSGFCASTTDSDQPWWEVDLEQSFLIAAIQITNRDKHLERLRDFEVLVDSKLCFHFANSFGSGTSYFPCKSYVKGQKVKIKLKGKNVLTLCEVDVIASKEGIAVNKTATQSAVFGYGEAWKAVDGFYGESYDNGQCTHTNEGLSWWKVDLAKQHIVAAVRITNRNALSERLSKFIVMVDTQICNNFTSTAGPGKTYLPCSRPLQGQTVKIKMYALGTLTLCEVDVIGDEI